MEKCPKYKQGVAFDVKFPQETIVYCGIEKGKCSYNNEGKRFTIDGYEKEYCICKTKGLIEKISTQVSIF